MSLPKWLRERLGDPVPGRGCRHVKCLVCKDDVIAGLDEDKAALAAVCDPEPLSVTGEALALIDGRKTYELKRRNRGQALWIRNWWDISARPPSEKNLVLAEHRCGGSKMPTIEIKPALDKKGLMSVNNDSPSF